MAARGITAADAITALVAANLQKILRDRSPESYCKEGRGLRYVSGRGAGKLVSPRALRYHIDGEQRPNLELLEAVADKEGIPAYLLLFPGFDPHKPPLILSEEDADRLGGYFRRGR